jgi:hypothetical protein
MVMLMSSEGQVIEVPLSHVRCSRTIANMLDDVQQGQENGPAVVPLPAIPMDALCNFLDYAGYHVNGGTLDVPTDVSDAWDDQYLMVEFCISLPLPLPLPSLSSCTLASRVVSASSPNLSHPRG